MSEEQLSALLAKLKDDAELQVKLRGAADLEAAVAMAIEAGFDVTVEDWYRYQSKLIPRALDDAELESIAGGWSKADGNGGGTQIICCGGCLQDTKNFDSHYVGCMT
jgi:predicted ribosomally synthesized peptide with nif11-like leader